MEDLLTADVDAFPGITMAEDDPNFGGLCRRFLDDFKDFRRQDSLAVFHRHTPSPDLNVTQPAGEWKNFSLEATERAVHDTIRIR
ncbi:MAG TPA: hypothetical protein PLU25_02935 [Acidobacteriota bacterium]|nr:hypothetical protein [Acidobacteriota bacterium]